jgi:5'(3')-deoxyribonucleotidase
MYAVKAYDSPHCIMSEFEGDLKRTKYLKRLFRRYKISKGLKERLILNHIILLYNVFGAEAATRILFYKIDEEDYDVLKTFLIYLNYMPDKITGINGKDIISSDILMDMDIANILRQI